MKNLIYFLLGCCALWFLKFALGKLTIATICGIPLKISGAFILFLGLLVGATYLQHDGTAAEALQHARFVLAIIIVAYLCVIPHEYGHALTAKRLGYKTKDITLWPYAGLASIEGEWHKNPKHEILIGIAGPGVNFFMGSIFIWCIPNDPEPNVWIYFFVFSFLLGCFNLLPLYPMDGGRVVRAICVMRRGGDVLRGTSDAQIITTVGACILCPLVWVYWSPVVAIILLCVVMFGRGEVNAIRGKIYEEEARERSPFAKEDEILDAYKKKAEELPESEREEYLRKMEKFHRWMTEVFTVNVQLAAKEFDDKEVALKVINQRWNNCVKFLCVVDEKSWWEFYDDFINVEPKGVRLIAIERFLKGICYAPKL